MEDEITRLPSSLKEDPSSPESSPSVVLPSIEREVNIMPLEELEQLRESCSISSSIQIRLPEEGETIMSACPSEVAFYEAAFHELFGLYKNSMPDSGWLYFKARVILGRRSFKGSEVMGHPRFLDDVMSSVEGGNLYLVKVILDSKTFRRSFNLLSNPMASGGGDNGEGCICWRGNSGNRRTRVSPSILEMNIPKVKALKFSFVAMSRRISLKKLSQKLEESKSESSIAKSTPSKGVVIGEKSPREASVTSPNKKGNTTLPSKKGKTANSSNGKEIVPPSEAKKVKPSNAASTKATPMLKPQLTLLPCWGLKPSILGSLSVAEKILSRAVPPADKEKVEQLTLDHTVTKFFHVIGQALLWSKERGDKVTLQQGRVASLEGKNVLSSTADKGRDTSCGAEAKGGSLYAASYGAVQVLSEFHDVVKAVASKYFGKEFDFCKGQLHRQHPDLAIDLEGMGLDHDLLDEEDELEGKQSNFKLNHGDHIDLASLISKRLEGDFVLMVISKFTGNTSSSAQRSMGDVVPFHSCLPTNTFLVWTLWTHRSPDRREQRDRSTSGGICAAGGGRLFMVRCYIKRALFSFMIQVGFKEEASNITDVNEVSSCGVNHLIGKVNNLENLPRIIFDIHDLRPSVSLTLGFWMEDDM
ncbi:hypothetical protein Acr_00g0055120 [Actinidia rufa]|uniref:Uncharacterized protein n=1 Tax=Actinidia rufa TaxID=165716 RepID=A0A7J0DNC3_9ERIC|nr:hypothetical protein Acr_00g0055120 [Actinidia rufa]